MYSFTLMKYLLCSSGFPGCKVVKSSPANAGDSGDTGSTWAGKMPWRRKRKPTPCSYWITPRTEKPGKLQSMGSQELDTTERARARARAHTHTHTHTQCSRYCCRKGDPFQGPKLGSCLTLRNELSKETCVLTKQEILLGKGTSVESSRVREPRRTAVPHGLGFMVMGLVPGLSTI